MLLKEKLNVFGDNIANVKHYVFSKANMSDENRILIITQVASICYQNPKGIGSEYLYNRLLSESKGLPSSSFEFVPVLLKSSEYHEIVNNIYESCDTDENGDILIDQEENTIRNFTLNIEKFGEWVEGGEYLLTNYRALVYDIENKYIEEKWYKRYNTEEECAIIAKHFKVFNFKVDLPTRTQMIRHRASWQELSRRYVSGKKVPFDFYIHEKMKSIKQTLWIDAGLNNQVSQDVSTENLINVCIEHYYKALESGIKPQVARGIIPQCAYTEFWGAFMPKHLENFFKLRLDPHAQWEIQMVAEAMKSLIEE